MIRLSATGGRLAVLVTSLVAATCLSSQVRADEFGSGSHTFSMPFTTIGAPNNPRDFFVAPNDVAAPPSGGSVSYVYRMATYEVSERMIDAANVLGGLGITKDERGPDMPATGITWLEAAQFINWLNVSTGSPPAYKFDASGNFQLWSVGDPGYDSANLFRNTLATYFLPSHDEWYKAAYYDPTRMVYYDYPTGSDTAPVRVTGGTAAGTAVYGSLTSPSAITSAGGPSPFGTFAQGGNVHEHMETELDKINDSIAGRRSNRGGAYGTYASALASDSAGGATVTIAHPGVGFRVARVIPEPSSGALTIAFLFLVQFRRRGLARSTNRVW